MDTGDTAWVLTSAALVLLMTPGLAFFYGGMVRSKSVLNMMMMSFGAMAVVGVLWVLFGYSTGIRRRRRRRPAGQAVRASSALRACLARRRRVRRRKIPSTVFVVFQADVRDHHGRADLRRHRRPRPVRAVAAVRPASGSRSSTSRSRTGCSTSTARTRPATSSTRLDRQQAPGDRLRRWHRGPHQRRCGGSRARDRARQARRLAEGADEAAQPAASCCWRRSAVVRLVRLQRRVRRWAPTVSPVSRSPTRRRHRAAMLGWLLIERIRDGKPTTLGAASGAIAGLVAITPACAFVTPLGAIAIGVIAGVLCALAVGLKYRFGYDDSLDVVGVHLVGGLVGTLLIGLFATTGVNSARCRRPVLRRWRRPARASRPIACGRGARLLVRAHA